MQLRSILVLASCLVASIAVCRAGGARQAIQLEAIATTDSEEVHPDSVFEVTLSLKNPTGTTETLMIPDCGWDRLWKSSDHRVTWDYWDCDESSDITITIPAHQSYVFPMPLKMFVNPSDKRTKIDFRMGFKTKAIGKALWSAPITLDVAP